MSEVTLQTIKDQLDAVLARLAPSSIVAVADVEPYHHRSLMLAEIDPRTIDGETIQIDGSTWTYDQGVPKGVIYGYISPEKDPALWDQLVAAFNGDEAHLVASLGIAFEPYLRFKVDPDAYLRTTKGPELLNLLSQAFSAPLPPARPTA